MVVVCLRVARRHEIQGATRKEKRSGNWLPDGLVGRRSRLEKDLERLLHQSDILCGGGWKSYHDETRRIQREEGGGVGGGEEEQQEENSWV